MGSQPFLHFSCSFSVIIVVKMKRSRPEKGISRGAPPVRKFLTEAAENRYKESVKRNQKLIEERGFALDESLPYFLRKKLEDRVCA